MKKIIISLVLSVLLLTGCSTGMGTPTEVVEDFLSKYQNSDSDVLTQLDSVISDDSSMSDDQKKDYRDLLEKQYQNLSYKVKNETVSDDTAVVDVEIEVYDYATSISKSRDYYDEHKDEFSDDKATINADDSVEADDNTNSNTKTIDSTDNTKSSDLNETSKFIDYKIKELKDVTDRVKYEISFNLSKSDGKWIVDDISDSDRQKIHGLFEE